MARDYADARPLDVPRRIVRFAPKAGVRLPAGVRLAWIPGDKIDLVVSGLVTKEIEGTSLPRADALDFFPGISPLISTSGSSPLAHQYHPFALW